MVLTMLPRRPNLSNKWRLSICFKMENMNAQKNMPFVKKSACGFDRVGLDSTSPAAQRCVSGASDGPDTV